jgi:hypothetical protein
MAKYLRISRQQRQKRQVDYNAKFLSGSCGPFFCFANQDPMTSIKDCSAHDKWIAYLLSGACETGKFRPKPPRTDLRRPGQQVTIHATRIKTRRFSKMLDCPPYPLDFFKECEACRACGPLGVRPTSAGAVWNDRIADAEPTSSRYLAS